MLWTKRAHQCIIFRLLSSLMKVHPILHAILETTMPEFIQILHHCSVSWKITPLCFLAQTLNTLDKNSQSKWKFGTLEWFCQNSQNFLSHLKLQVSFSLNLASLFNVKRDNFFRWNLYYFDKSSPSKCQILDFRFHQTCTLIGFFLLKVYKISAKKVQRSCVSWYWKLMQNLKEKWFVVSKLMRIW